MSKGDYMGCENSMLEDLKRINVRSYAEMEMDRRC